MADSMKKHGLFIDDMSKIRILEPEVASQTNKLKEECQNFVIRIEDFHKAAEEFITIMSNLAEQVEREKMRSIGIRNLLHSLTKEHDVEKQQLEALLLEKNMELERLRVQYESLKKIESEQLETIEHLMAN
ncbi:PREDICTED: intraflagellar transport protein 20 homolog [Ceratosolen solmsi marchali]|uniref:Intraflagellar transport protein 20 homolog n=1 Tax=Ceratosolen solmsi marchali TaxID=326594 RepID=A0AAJ6YX31_9HYME|nr:PREDICTED: intraflagellar transport protein 20 homolog [Ceratosolen solmsi marchali]